MLFGLDGLNCGKMLVQNCLFHSCCDYFAWWAPSSNLLRNCAVAGSDLQLLPHLLLPPKNPFQHSVFVRRSSSIYFRQIKKLRPLDETQGWLLALVPHRMFLASQDHDAHQGSQSHWCIPLEGSHLYSQG